MRKQKDSGYSIIVEKSIELCDKPYNASKSWVNFNFCEDKNSWKPYRNTPSRMVNVS